jgi:hypothetical protein
MIQLLSAKGHILEPLSVKKECMGIKEIVTYPFNLDISPTEIPTPGILHEGNKDIFVGRKSSIDDQEGNLEPSRTIFKHLPII